MGTPLKHVDVIQALFDVALQYRMTYILQRSPVRFSRSLPG